MTESITGRDSDIIAKALAYAIEAIDRLPFEEREESDRSDMKKLLEHMVSSDSNLEMIIESVRRHLGKR